MCYLLCTCINVGWFAAITNIKKEEAENSPVSFSSRGEIPLKLLSENNFDPIEWKRIIKSSNCKNFNVIFGDLNGEEVNIYVYSSERGEEIIKIPSTLNIFSLANGEFIENESKKWFKQRRGEELIKNSIEELSEDLMFNILT